MDDNPLNRREFEAYNTIHEKCRTKPEFYTRNLVRSLTTCFVIPKIGLQIEYASLFVWNLCFIRSIHSFPTLFMDHCRVLPDSSNRVDQESQDILPDLIEDKIDIRQTGRRYLSSSSPSSSHPNPSITISTSPSSPTLRIDWDVAMLPITAQDDPTRFHRRSLSAPPSPHSPSQLFFTSINPSLPSHSFSPSHKKINGIDFKMGFGDYTVWFNFSSFYTGTLSGLEDFLIHFRFASLKLEAEIGSGSVAIV